MAGNLIIGGGVYGAAVAFELASRGVNCHLVEAKHIGAGASSGPGRRGVRANGRDPRELPLVRQARTIWSSLHELLGVAPLFERTGHVLLIERERDLLEAEARVKLQDQMGIPSELVKGEGVRDYEPQVSSHVRAAIVCPGDGVADHTATTNAYAAAAAAAGAVVEEAVPVVRLVIKRDRVIAVETDTGSHIQVENNLFILANSAVRGLLTGYADLPVRNMPFQVLLSKPLGNVPVRHLVGHAHRTLALKAEPGERVMISGGRAGRWDEERQVGEVVDQEVAANIADAVKVYPSLQDIEIEIADAGHLEAVSIDNVPIIDRLPGLSNVKIATGWSGHGWAIAPSVAKLLVDWALEGQRPPLLAPFALTRFGR